MGHDATASSKGAEPPLAPRDLRRIAACLVVLAALTALDLWTKHWAIQALSAERRGPAPAVCEPDEHGRVFMQRMRTAPVVLIDGYLELRYAENCGAAFGLFSNAPLPVRHTVFGLAAVLASVALLWMFVRGQGGPMFAVSVPFIVSGAVGNLVDRIRFGYVVDFIRAHIHETAEWPTFNVADSTITVGVALLLLDALREGRRKQAQEQQGQTDKRTARQ